MKYCFIFALLLSNIFCQAQGNKFHIEVGEYVSFTKHHITPLTFNVTASYDLTKKIYGLAKIDGIIALYKSDELKTYMDACNLGGGLGWKINTKKNGSSIDIRASIGQTIGSSTWKQTTYDAGVFFISKNNILGGLGFRHINSHQSGVNDHNSIFVMLGVRF